MTSRGLLRAGLLFMAVGYGLAGLVQLLLPKVFYDDFPAPGRSWVALLPPYNEHLMTDVGALTLASVLVLVVAAIRMERVLVRTALAVSLVFAVPHFGFHVLHLEHFPASSAVSQTVVLGIGVVLPCVLLALSARRGALEPVVPRDGEPAS
ncbi:hypothetical protein ORV05_35520 [Amycolatopsis cynarae]|uniref:DUF4267 domain-containing protein n=1 Tax=Amycolatopsis cynarae TaxID=2995223 RepID=A0ABY7B4D2_9PSEU|nr:hypothetical protein [Amycolatopsis sp. HUAS 11-8]WAL66097.1 hypothetical protein ORV05_35520 [Amycolatopsis sp. HUAS 11-8]